MSERRITSGNVTLRVLDEGEGQPVIFLHGFPDAARLWRNQVPALVDAGFRTIALDQRGFGESDKPQDVSDYAMHLLLGDIRAVMDALQIERAHVVGHDWGAAVSWLFAMFEPTRVDKLVALSVGCPGALRRRTASHLRNWWYMFAFQATGIVEEALMRDDWLLFREFAGGHAPDLERSIEELSRPGALTAALNWYRANATPKQLLGEVASFPQVRGPAMGIWSTWDFALTEDQMVDSGSMVTGEWRYERIEDAGHWIPLDAAARVNELLIDFLR
jgi:pimeloyl-ACP methyl ester carboxylesterase